MPITYRIDSDLGVVFTNGTGILTDDELVAHRRRLADDPLLKLGMVELVDHRAVERYEVTSTGMEILAAMDSASANRCVVSRRAIVTSNDRLFGMARMYQAKSAIEVRVFRDMGKAEAWLGIPQEV